MSTINDSLRLMVIDNFITYYTTNDEERDALYDEARAYIAEDHADELQGLSPSGVWINVYASGNTDTLFHSSKEAAIAHAEQFSDEAPINTIQLTRE